MINQVTLIGNLGKDPDLRYTKEGLAVANLSMATNETWIDSAGESQRRTEWHRVVVFGKLAELCEVAKNLYRKGKQVFVSGSLQTREWEDKDGVKRWTTEIRARQMRLLGSAPASPPHPAETAENRVASAAQLNQQAIDSIPF